jgi:hypothetical protein
VDSLGREHLVAQTGRTPGAENPGPRVGPVVINEILFHPPPAGTNNNILDEFLELRNITADAVPLYDPAFPSSTWRLRGGVEFDLPPAVLLPSGHSLLLVNFDPDLDLGPLAAFRARYQVPDEARILGPYRGNLDNDGERLALYQPDTPQGPGTPDPGFVPQILVDEVRYSPLPPWPGGAAGTGQSLQRIHPLHFGDDPAHWRVAPPTAGAFNTDPDPDWDHDGLPNEWEIEVDLDPRNALGDEGPEGDPDRDGMANLQEMQAGTHPRSTSSVLSIRSVTVSDIGTLVRFEAMSGRTYTVEYAADPVLGPWLRLAEVPSGPDVREVAVPDPAQLGTRFYRLVTPAVP